MAEIGNEIEWEVDRATKAKQDEKGPRLDLMHEGAGAVGDPHDIFERGSGNMSDTDDEEEYRYDETTV